MKGLKGREVGDGGKRELSVGDITSLGKELPWWVVERAGDRSLEGFVRMKQSSCDAAGFSVPCL